MRSPAQIRMTVLSVRQFFNELGAANRRVFLLASFRGRPPLQIGGPPTSCQCAIASRRRGGAQSGKAASFVPVLSLALALLLLPAGPALADAVQRSHGLSSFGDLKYGPDFTHFDYVNPDAPKGGHIRTTPTYGAQGFDSLNAYILKGDAPNGLQAPTNLVFDTLMASATDESDAMYGLLASHIEYIPGKWVTFDLREEARFSDGTPVRAEDVVFTFEALVNEGAPTYRLALGDVEKAEVLSPLRVRYTFKEGANARDLPMLVAGLPVLSKAWYSTRDFAESSLEPPLGSGPYRVGKVVPGRSVTYERRDDYWAADLPVNRGRWNFDQITFEYFADRNAGREALKAGEMDLREEFTSKAWATEYDIPAIDKGLMIREVLPDGRPAGTQGFWINMRKEKFRNPAVREAIGIAFDFEWTNKTLFYGLYKRTHSFFQNSDMEADGEPDAQMLAALGPFRESLPEAAFEAAYVPPVTDGSGRNRKGLRKAMGLLEAAGWTLEGKLRKNADGETLSIEFLDRSGSGFARIVGPYIKNLEKLGIEAVLREVDTAQYQRRFENFDFDIATARYAMNLTPGPSLREMFSSEAADTKGTNNLSGIKSEVADALIEQVMAARTREELNASARALDHVLRAERIWVPQWYKASHTIAYWDRFSRPEIKPTYGRAILDTWWFDAQKAAALREKQ